MSDYSAGAALAFDFNAASGTTGNFTPSGSNLAAFATVSIIEFGSKTLNECRLGGSGGSVMTRVGSDYSFHSTAILKGLFQLTGIAAAQTNGWSGWASTPLQCCISAAVYSGVDQTTPLSDEVQNTGQVTGVSTTVATITVPNCTIGQRIAGCVTANADNVSLTAFTAVTGEGTLRNQDHTNDYLGPVWLDKLATATGDNTLQVNVNTGSATQITWGFRAFRINDAAGANGAGSLTAYQRLKSKLMGLVQ